MGYPREQVNEKEVLREKGWLPCATYFHVKLSAREDPGKCQACFGRGWAYLFGRGTGAAFGQCYRKKCSQCSGNWANESAYLDDDFKEAIRWFLESTPPAKRFRLHPWKVIESPEKLWDSLFDDIQSQNVYRLEFIRDDLVKLHQLFGISEDFE